MNSIDSKIYRISGQFQQNIGPANRTVSYIDPTYAPLYTLVPPDFLYFTWDNNPTGSAWLGDNLGTAGWSPLSGKSAAENGSEAWIVSASLSASSGRWGRRLGMSTDGKAFDDNGLYVERPSEQTVPAYLHNALLSGSYTVAFFARTLFDFGTNANIYASNDFKDILTVGARVSDEANNLLSVGSFFSSATGIKMGMQGRSGASTSLQGALSGTSQVADGQWHHYALSVGRDKSGLQAFPTDYPTMPSDDLVGFGDGPLLYTDGNTLFRGTLVKPWGQVHGFETSMFATSGSYADLLYIGLNGYSNDTCCQMEVSDLVILSGALYPDAGGGGLIGVTGSDGYVISSLLKNAILSGTNGNLPHIMSRFFNEQPIVDKLRTYPLTVRAHTGSLSRMFNHNGYIEIDQLRYKENIGCLIGPADHDISQLFCTGSYTLEGWLSCSNVDTNLRTAFAFGSSGNGPNSTYLGKNIWFYLDQNKNFNLSVFSGTNSATEATGAFIDLSMSLSTWHHVQLSVTRSPSNVYFMTASCYIDGVSAGSQVYKTSPFNGLSGSMWIGMKNHVIENHVTVSSDETAVWSGRIGHLKVWKEARSQADAVNVYTSERHFYDDKVS